MVNNTYGMALSSNEFCTNDPGISELRDKLVVLSLISLEQMYNDGKKLFCFRAINNGNSIIYENTSFRYTLICLLGLRRCEINGIKSPVNIKIKDSISELIQKRNDFNNAGDLGLLLWLCSMFGSDYGYEVEDIVDILNRPEVFEKYDDVHNGSTMEMSWLLTGLLFFVLNRENPPEDLYEFCNKIYNLVVRNYGGKGVFAHCGGGRYFKRIRRHIASFADQVYPIYALSLYSHVFKSDKAADIVKKCSETICRLQGPLGQWWWHYNYNNGNVFENYPVYSVHQHGMAPMALFANKKMTGLNYDREVINGLKWITGNNELGVNLVDELYHLVWRCVHTNKLNTCKNIAQNTIFNKNNYSTPKENLFILKECWSYELGWLLYAIA